MLGPARDQDPRPTCMAFAASDAHAGARPGWEQLSPEWAYYHALQRDGARLHEGVRMGTMLETLRSDGQPPEDRWPYVAALFDDHSSWRPPEDAGAVFRRDSRPAGATVDAIVAELDQDHPVIFTMSISPAFYRPGAYGVISSDETLMPHRVHALVAVGHGSLAGDRLILVRNSWGVEWGDAGHGWVDAAYVAPRLLVAATLTGAL
jgi:hypothetical protein